MLFGFFDPLYFVFLAPGLALSLYATFKTKRTFSKYSQVGSRSGMTGAQAAALMLQRNGIHGVSIEQTSGWLSDHYDPGPKALRLSEDVYSSQSLSAIGVACHEAGHAIQDASNYGMLSLRTAPRPRDELQLNGILFPHNARLFHPTLSVARRRVVCRRRGIFADYASCRMGCQQTRQSCDG